MRLNLTVFFLFPVSLFSSVFELASSTGNKYSSCVCFPCGSAGKESACSAGDLGSIPGLGRSPGEGKGYPLQYSGLENSMDSIPVALLLPRALFLSLESRLGFNGSSLLKGIQTIKETWLWSYSTYCFYSHSTRVDTITWPQSTARKVGKRSLAWPQDYGWHGKMEN